MGPQKLIRGGSEIVWSAFQPMSFNSPRLLNHNDEVSREIDAELSSHPAEELTSAAGVLIKR